MATNKKSTDTRKESEELKTESSTSVPNEDEPFRTGDFVRCTFEDGIDYEAEILSINENGTALIRYIGYGNEQRVKVDELVASWGIEAREEQKLLAEADNPTDENMEQQEELHSFIMNKSPGVHGKLPIPPMVCIGLQLIIIKLISNTITATTTTWNVQQLKRYRIHVCDAHVMVYERILHRIIPRTARSKRRNHVIHRSTTTVLEEIIVDVLR